MLMRIAGAVLMLLALVPSIAHAEKRVALVIGNSAYKYAGELSNPRNDAGDIAGALKSLNFQVIEGNDLDRGAMERKLREFARALEGADVGLFFYAGHGLQARGVNYLLGTDAMLEAERDLEFETLKLETVLTHMEREAKTNIVFLDACRNNPLARNLARTMGTRGVSETSGLAPVKSGLGTFIAFATQPGNVASDGAERNSPFTAALKRRIAEPNLAVGDLMIEVRKEVVEATKGGQVPWDHSALQGRFYFNVTISVSPSQPATATPPAPPAAPPRLSEAASEWSRLDKTSTVELETFLRRHGSSQEAEYARARLADLKSHQQAKASPPPPSKTADSAAEAWAAANSTTSIAVLQDFIARYNDTFYAGLARARIAELAKAETTSARTDSAPRDVTPALPQRSRETVRSLLYGSIMQHLSQRPSPGNSKLSITGYYRAAPNPKAMAVCIDWERTTPTLVDYGQIRGSHRDRNNGCGGLTSDQCGRHALDKCRDRCSSQGQQCVLVDVNGSNALALNEVWAKKFAQ